MAKQLLLNTPKKLLLAVAQFFEDHPERHTKYVLARDNRRRSIGAASEKAYSFCALGAMLRLEFEGSTSADVRKRAIAAYTEKFRWIASENDNQKPADFIQRLRIVAGNL